MNVSIHPSKNIQRNIDGAKPTRRRAGRKAARRIKKVVETLNVSRELDRQDDPGVRQRMHKDRARCTVLARNPAASIDGFATGFAT